jgi:hypothetical protein
MTAYAPLTLGQTFGKLADEQAQQQTAYLLLKGKAEEQLGLSEEIVEGLPAKLDGLKIALGRDDIEMARTLIAEAVSLAECAAHRLQALADHTEWMEKARG